MGHADQVLQREPLTNAEVARANLRGRIEQASAPVLEMAFVADGALCLAFESGVKLAIPTALVEGLSDKTTEEIGEAEVSPSGLGLYFPRVDCDLFIPGLLKGVFGTKAWMSQLAEAGRLGGSKTSEKKAQASRENGKLGGRPRITRVR